MNSETTNVDPKIKACIATMEAQNKEFNPKRSTELAIREYLAKNPTTKIPLENNRIREGAKEAIREHLAKNPTTKSLLENNKTKDVEDGR
ncbi:MAG: hypothetical protein IJB90_00875 [Clostridia bacterium]|nr:hypothetical protein [Clostridia bacterium]